MEKENLYQYVHTMITSSTHRPKYMSISSVKVADLLGIAVSEVENGLHELVMEGRLQTSKLGQPPNCEIYLLP
ncbi:hypothetical protein [Neobacillus ginsengisoli]|uniref:DNA-binding transcriptional MocR family regulator n=1 Tax=Neobacillus ginsengisoli TaxID=904295 RepID=A0ABT9Y4E4_9BACI|nr:hypothetical protein [Neobacillus ginsengisoli]MDQ0202047.1 DNA-binding transcriptional MocR family regulator [Neobacillus ginsengisoli]